MFRLSNTVVIIQPRFNFDQMDVISHVENKPDFITVITEVLFQDVE
jgi:hypothetical protein